MEDYLGKAKELLSTEVPTLRDCLRLACLIQKKHLLELDRGKTKPIKDVLAEVVSRVYDQWKLSNILFVPPVTILPWSLQKKLQSAWDKISYMLGHKTKQSVKDMLYWEGVLDKLVDIVLCKCPITLCPIPCKKDCPGAHAICCCPKLSKVPVLELSWLHAQRQKLQERSSHAMTGGDMKHTIEVLKTEKRKADDEERVVKKKKPVVLDVEDLSESEDSETERERKKCTSKELTARLKLARQKLGPGTDHGGGGGGSSQLKEHTLLPREAGELLIEHDGSNNDELNIDMSSDNLAEGDAAVEQGPKTKSQKRNNLPIPNTAAASVRFGTSQAETAAITSGFLLDLIEAGHLPPEKAHLAVNKNKVARAKTAVLEIAGERGEQASSEDNIKAIFFDGRKDKTQVLDLLV